MSVLVASVFLVCILTAAILRLLFVLGRLHQHVSALITRIIRLEHETRAMCDGCYDAARNSNVECTIHTKEAS